MDDVPTVKVIESLQGLGNVLVGLPQRELLLFARIQHILGNVLFNVLLERVNPSSYIYKACDIVDEKL